MQAPGLPPSCIRGALLAGGPQGGAGGPFFAMEADNATFDPVMLQCAAVAAQQAALADEEAKLVQRRVALEKQEDQLAAHLEQKRLELIQQSNLGQIERAALEKDRLGFEEQMKRAAADMRAAQRELLNRQQRNEAERERLEARERALTEKCLRFHTQYELGRCQFREAWQRLRQDQLRWKHRRGQERAALKVRRLETEASQRQLQEAQRLFSKEKRAWEHTRAVLQAEVLGLEARVTNQRAKLNEQQMEINRLAERIAVSQPRDQESGQPPGGQPPGADAAPQPAAGQPATLQSKVAALARVSQPADLEPVAAMDSPPSSLQALPIVEIRQKRVHDLDRLAGDLADQRLQLAEQWDRLGYLQARWEQEQSQASRELEKLARRLVDNGHLLSQREQAGLQADQVLRHRHEELVQIRQEMIAWRTRLRVREAVWEGERNRLLTDVRGREELAERHLGALVDLRQRWAKRRQQELVKLREERLGLDATRKALGRQRLALADQTAVLERDKRIVAEKSLALERHRQELPAKASPAAQRRLERLRRRWIALNAAAIRAAARERESLKAILLALEERLDELHQRAEAVAQAEADLAQRQTSWEHKQTLVAARQSRLQRELHSAEAQRKLSEQQLARMKEEIERIARALIDEPDPPISEALNHAA